MVGFGAKNLYYILLVIHLCLGEALSPSLPSLGFGKQDEANVSQSSNSSVN